VVAIEVREILGREDRSELAGQDLGVRVAHPEGQQGSHVSEDRCADRLGELLEILVGEREREAVLPSLGEDRLEAIRREVVELVDREMEVSAEVLGLIGARECRELEGRDEQRAQ
jgi:hypothetical protein